MNFPKITEYLFTPKDAWKGILYLAKNATFRDLLGVLLLPVVFVGVHYIIGWSLEAGIFWMFIVSMWYWRIDSRVAIGAALVCLVIIPLLLTLFRQEIFLTGEYWAERVAVWAYYFLVIGVVRQIFEYIKEQRQAKPDSNIRDTDN